MLTYLEDCKYNLRKAVYKCECGNTIVAFKNNVSRGHTKSCGCYRKKVTKERSLKHGHKSNGKRSKAYIAWVNMKSRCNNSNRNDSKNYCDRGISYHERWEYFDNFLNDMGEPKENYSLDRIDNSKGYSKANCRWATAKTQNSNKRNNVYYEVNGKSKTLSEWCHETGVNRVTALKRIQRGIPIEDAISFNGYLKS